MGYQIPYRQLVNIGAATLASVGTGSQKSNYRTGYPSTVMVTQRKKPRLAKRNTVKKEIMAMATTYHDTIPDNEIVNSTLNHNLVYSFNITAQVVQGTLNSSRQGDSIYIAALKFRAFIQSAAPANAYSYRILIGWSGEEAVPTTLLTTGLTANEVFLPLTGVNWTPNSIVNPKAFTVLYDATIDIDSQIAAVATGKSFMATVPINQKFDYQSSASIYGKNKNLYVVVCPAQIGGGPCGSIFMATDLIFKNL